MRCSVAVQLLLLLLLPLSLQQQDSCPREVLSPATEDPCYHRTILCQYYPSGVTCSDNISRFRANNQGSNTRHELRLIIPGGGFRVSPGSTDYQAAVLYGCDIGAVTVEAFDTTGVVCGIGSIDPGMNIVTFLCPGFSTLTMDNSSIIVFTLKPECSDNNLPDAKFAMLDTRSKYTNTNAKILYLTCSCTGV